MAKRKISSWLGIHDGHDILDYEMAAADFKKETGRSVSSWEQHVMSRRVVEDALQREGRGGHIGGEGPFVAVLDLSDMYAATLADYSSPKLGRGSRHRDNVRALKEAGK